jgi:hypothetical protein
MLFLPVIILVVALVALASSNLFGRGFRSNWLLATSAAFVSWLSLLFLRFRLPLTLEFSSWWVGDGLVQSTSFVVDEFSWSIAFAIGSLLLSGLFLSVHYSITAPWHSWLPPLGLAAVAILATFSGDALAFAFTFTLVDSLVFALQIVSSRTPDERRSSLTVYFVNLVSILLLIGAWSLSEPWPVTANLVILLSIALRLQVFNSDRGTKTVFPARVDHSIMLRGGSFAASLALVVRGIPLGENLLPLVVAVLILPAGYAGYRVLISSDVSGSTHYWAFGNSILALAASIGGNAAASLAFGMFAMFGAAFFTIVPGQRHQQLAMIGLGLLALSSLPFTPGSAVSTIYKAPVTLVNYAFLAVQGMLVAGWILQRKREQTNESPAEPWISSIRTLGTYAQPSIFLLYGFGLSQPLGPTQLENPLWPSAGILLLAGLFSFLRSRKMSLLPDRLSGSLQRIASLNWIEYLFMRLFAAIGFGLNILARILEGQAGVLWAVLLIALLLSLVAQYALPG